MFKLCLPAETARETAARILGQSVPTIVRTALTPYVMGDVRDVTVTEAAKAAGVSESTFRKRINGGAVPAYKVPGRVQGSEAWRVQIVTAPVAEIA